MSSHRQALTCPPYDHLVLKKRTKSVVWQYFGLPADESGNILNEQIAICKLCERLVSSKDGSTSNMSSHLKLYHALEFHSLTSDAIHATNSRDETEVGNNHLEEAQISQNSDSSITAGSSDDAQAFSPGKKPFSNKRLKTEQKSLYEYDRLVSKKKAKNPIWQHFGFPANKRGKVLNEQVIICKLCEYSIPSKGGKISNMNSHLKLYHPLEFRALKSDGIHATNSRDKAEVVNNFEGAQIAPGNSLSTTASSPGSVRASSLVKGKKPFLNKRLKILKKSLHKYDQLVPKRKTKSHVWQHFGLPADKSGKVLNTEIAICKLCDRPVPSRDGSTSNMNSHLKLYHPLEFYGQTTVSMHVTNSRDEIKVDNSHIKGTQSTPCSDLSAAANSSDYVQAFSLDNESYLNKSLKSQYKSLQEYAPLDADTNKRCTDAITKFLATTMQPYRLVEQQAFTDMIKVLNPGYELPGRKYFSHTGVPKLYTETVSKIQEILTEECKAYVSLTSDLWKSWAGYSYIAITAHFINSDWNLKSICLSCAYFEKNYTSENITDAITNILSDWGLSVNNIVSCTTENTPNILRAVERLGIHHVSCFGHNCNTSVNQILELPQVKKSVTCLKKLQNTIAHNWKMKRDLQLTQELLQINLATLPSAYPTRWWSTIKLCERFLENQLAICKMLQGYPEKKQLMLEESEISPLEDLVSATSEMKAITENLSAEEHITASSVLPLYRNVKEKLEVKDTDSNLMKKMKEEIVSVLTSHYDQEPLKSLLQMCTFVDPRFRLDYFDDSDKDIVKAAAIQKLVEVMPDNQEPHKTVAELALPQTKKKGLSNLLKLSANLSVKMSPELKAKKEIENYLAIPTMDLDDDPLIWWKSHENSFPALKFLARKFLAVQGTSVPSERMFGTGENVITRQRASLTPKNAEMQVFLSYNRKFLSY